MISLNLTQVALLISSIMAVGALAWKGAWPERVIALAIVVVVVSPLFVQGLEAGNIKWAVALVSAAFSTLLFALALTSDRWWLLASAGCQGVATASYAVALMHPNILIYSGVALRRLLWFELMAVCLFGAWEAARRQQPPSVRREQTA